MRYRIAIAMICLTFLLGGCFLPLPGEEESAEINTVKDLVSYAENGIARGWEEAEFSTEKLSEQDLKTINDHLECFYGSVSRYEITTNKLTEKKKVRICFDISEDYYVVKELTGEGEESDDPRVRELADRCREIFDQLGIDQLGTDYSKERAFHDYLVRTVDYGRPQKEEDANTSYGALINKKAVCDGYARAMKLLLEISGIKNQIITGRAGGESHAWNLVSLDDAWYHVDVTWDDPTSDVPVSDAVKESRIMFNYLNIADGEMVLDHDWDASRYPAAEGSYYNYFRLNGLECGNYEEFKRICTDLIRKKPGRQSLQLLIRNYTKEEYSDQNLQFLFDESHARRYQYFTSGPKERTGMYILLGYDEQ